MGEEPTHELTCDYVKQLLALHGVNMEGKLHCTISVDRTVNRPIEGPTNPRTNEFIAKDNNEILINIRAQWVGAPMVCYDDPDPERTKRINRQMEVYGK